MKRMIALVLLFMFAFTYPVPGLAVKDFTVYYSGDPDSMQVAITVDDLYEPINLRNMLDICEKYGARATFFTLGIVIKPEHADLWQRIVDEGHEIGNHTYGHLNITKLTREQLARQLRLAQEALDAVLREPYPMRLFRPPYGAFDHRGYGSVDRLGEQGYPNLILWSLGLDYVQQSFKNVKGGSIVLFHTNWQDVQCMDMLIPYLQDAGYELVTVSELLDLEPAPEGNAGG